MTAAMLLGSAGSAFAHICINASKNDNNPSAWAQIISGAGDEILHITNGLAKRIEKGLVDLENEEGFHAIIAADFDGDGEADLHTSSSFRMTRSPLSHGPAAQRAGASPTSRPASRSAFRPQAARRVMIRRPKVASRPAHQKQRRLIRTAPCALGSGRGRRHVSEALPMSSVAGRLLLP